MITYTYKPSQVCSTEIKFSLDKSLIIHDLRFIGGCNGNSKGITNLVEGMNAIEAIKKLKGIKCGYKQTSCPDQLAQALENALTFFDDDDDDDINVDVEDKNE